MKVTLLILTMLMLIMTVLKDNDGSFDNHYNNDTDVDEL